QHARALYAQQPAPAHVSPLSLHDALPILTVKYFRQQLADHQSTGFGIDVGAVYDLDAMTRVALRVTDASTTRITWDTGKREQVPDRKSTRLNSSHVSISYAVSCLKKKNNP